MNTFPVEIVAIDKVAYAGPCVSLVVPAIDGEFGIMAGHEPVVVAIEAGELRYTLEDDPDPIILAVGEGFVEVTEKTCHVMVDFAEKADEIDMIRAQAAADRARDRIKAKQDARTVAHAEAALARAIARLRVGGKNAIH